MDCRAIGMPTALHWLVQLGRERRVSVTRDAMYKRLGDGELFGSCADCSNILHPVSGSSHDPTHRVTVSADVFGSTFVHDHRGTKFER